MEFLYVFVLPLYALTVIAAAVTSVRGGAKWERVFYGLLTALWAMIALLRPWGASPDDVAYEGHFALACKFSECGFKDRLGFSYLYYLAIGMLRDVADTYAVFLWLSAAFFVLKMLLIGRLTKWSTLSLLTYVSIFFLLHDIVQFRVAVASFFMLAMFHQLSERRYLASIGSYATSILAHVQSAILPVAMLLERLLRQWYWLSIAVCAAALALTQLHLTPTSRLLSVIAALKLEDPRLANAVVWDDRQAGIGLSNLIVLTILALAVPSLRKANEPLLRIAFYSVVAGFILYWMAGAVGGISSRLSQMMWVPLVLLAPLARRDRLFFAGLLTACAAFFYLMGWINLLISGGGGPTL